MKKKRLVVVVIILLLVITAIMISRFSIKTEKSILALSGNVEVTETNVGFKAAGRVVELNVDEGQQVKAGQLLARIDDAEAASIVAQYRAALHEASVKLSELRAGSRAQEIERAKANLQSYAADLEKARKDYERAEMLHRNGAISTSQLDAATSAYKSREAQFKSAEEALSMIKEGPRQEDIRAAEHRVEQARAAVRAAEARMNDTRLYSPVAGIVIRKNAELGETLAAGRPALTIGDLENPWVKVYVKEDRLGQVKLGQRAEVTVDSFKGKTYEGTVTYIASEAEFTPKSVQTEEERVKLVFGVKVRVRNENGELKPGMPADVKIALK